MKRPQGEKLNNLIVRSGVVWHDCDACGRAWPFPSGPHDDREWRCHACVQALWGRLQRARKNIQAFVAAIGDISVAEAQDAIDREIGEPS